MLIEKTKERPDWKPPTLAELNDSDVEAKFFSQFSPENGTAPTVDVPTGVDTWPHKPSSLMRFALPTEEEIKQLVTGAHEMSGGTGITEVELIQKLETLRKGKMGIREKVADVVQRKCVAEPFQGSREKYLRWKD